jgi:hypothetical protein
MKNTFEIGEEVETSVVQISGDTVFIDLGLKSEGFVDAAEFRNDEGELTVHEGDKIKAFFVGDNRGELHFTTRLSGESAGNEMLEKAYKAGKIHAIGLSNFQTDQIQEVIDNGEIRPMIMQLECHPYFPAETRKPYCDANDIRLQSWFPLGHGSP